MKDRSNESSHHERTLYNEATSRSLERIYVNAYRSVQALGQLETH